MSCAKTADAIDLPFGLWTLVGRRKHSSTVFARWRQCAVMGGNIGAPGEYNWTVCLLRWCDLTSNYFDRLFWL